MKMRFREFLIALGLLAAAGLVILPMLGRAREAAGRASCQNNLKQLGIVLKMYANESKSSVFPPLSPRPGNWMMDLDAVYPEYLSDLSILKCPNSPLNYPQDFKLRQTLHHPGAHVNTFHPDCVTGKYYTYTGYVLTGDEPALALYLAYHANPEAPREMRDFTLPIPHWENSTWRRNMGGMPVLWDRIPLDSGLLPHANARINVLTMDGVVQSVRYSPLNPSENFPVTELCALTFGMDVPETDPDCF